MNKPPSELTFSNKAQIPGYEIGHALKISWGRAQQYRALRAWQAIHCGLVCMIAKDVIGHGEFVKWLEERATEFGIRMRSARNYMTVARRCMEGAELSARKILKSGFLRWGIESASISIDTSHSWDYVAADFWHGDAVFTAVKAYVGERSLTDIYHDEGIKREQEAHQTHTPAGNGQMTFDDIKEGWELVITQINALGHVAQTWADLPDESRWKFMETTLPVIRDMARGTKMTTAQREQLERWIMTTAAELKRGGVVVAKGVTA